MSGRICIFHKRLVHGFFLFYHSKPLNSTHIFLKKAGKCLTIQKFTQKKQRKSIFSLFYDKSLKLSFSNSFRYSLYMEGFPFTHTVLRPETSPVRALASNLSTQWDRANVRRSMRKPLRSRRFSSRDSAALRSASWNRQNTAFSFFIFGDPLSRPAFPAELTIRSYRIHVNFFIVFDLVSIFIDIFFIYTLYYFAINVN